MTDEELRHSSATDDDANGMLDDLLLRLEGILAEVRGATDGLPHSVVETTLREAL